MKKKSTLWDTVKYYCILQFLAAALLFYLSRNYILALLCDAIEITPRSGFYNLYRLAIYIGLIALWVAMFFISTRSKRYKKLTGRNFAHDNGKYKRTYGELVDYFKDADPHKLNTDIFEEKNWKQASGIIFGMDGKKLIQIPANCESNISIMGPPGSGKTSGIVITNAVKFPGSVLAIDVKGDIYNFAKKYRKIVRFCPDNPNALTESCHFDPMAGIKKMNITDKKLYLESMATVLIPDEGGSDGNYFTTRARKYFQGIAHMMLYENPDTKFPDIVHAILKGNFAEWVFKAHETECTEAAELLLSFEGNSEKNVSGAYDNLCTALTPFSNPVLDQLLDGKGKCVSIKTLEKGYDVYLQISQEHLDAYAPLFTLLIQSFSTAFTKRPDSSTGAKNRPILMLLDEFPQLTFSYKMINSNLSTLRSKSIVIAIIQQNLSQLEYRYQPTGARSILGNCNYQIILGSNDINSSKVFSETFGTHKILKVSNSETTSDKTSSGRSIQEAREPIFYPEDFGDLSSTKEMAIYFKGKWCKCKKINCYTDK